MQKIVWFILIGGSLLSGCQRDNGVPGDYFVFGVAYGFCMSDCAQLYQMKEGKLFADSMDKYPGEPLKFLNTPMSDDDYMKAKALLDSLPDYFLQHPDQTIGCPDCADQGGYHLLLRQDGVEHFWHVDTSVGQQPVEIQPFMQQLSAALQELNK